MTPETRALLLAADAAVWQAHTLHHNQTWRTCNHGEPCDYLTLATRLRAAADAGEGEDAKRLDWLSAYARNGESMDLLWRESRCTDTLREAIDAAMREAR